MSKTNENTVTFRFENGDVLKDKVTGFEGLVMAKAEYSSGCHHYALAPKVDKEGKLQEWEWLDQSRLDLIEVSAISFNVDTDNPSGALPSGPGK